MFVFVVCLYLYCICTVFVFAVCLYLQCVCMCNVCICSMFVFALCLYLQFVCICSVFVSVFGCRLTGGVHYSAAHSMQAPTHSLHLSITCPFCCRLPPPCLCLCLLPCLFACLLLCVFACLFFVSLFTCLLICSAFLFVCIFIPLHRQFLGKWLQSKLTPMQSSSPNMQSELDANSCDMNSYQLPDANFRVKHSLESINGMWLSCVWA